MPIMMLACRDRRMSMSGMARSHKFIIEFVQLLEEKLHRSFEVWRKVEKIGSRATERNSAIPPALYGYSISRRFPSEMSAWRKSVD